jgi:undecaprenyl-diphosphatase
LLLESIFLGILQGIFEWLPISSQGNLVLIMVFLLGIEESQALNLSIYLHTGTLLAVIIYFRKMILTLLRQLPKFRFTYSDNKENRLISFLFFSTILTGILGYPIYRFVETTTMLGEIFVALIGVALIATGLFQKSRHNLGNRTIKEINIKDTLMLGLMQGLSAIPGISRSGVTTSGLLFRGLNSEHALNLSLLMSVPTVLAAEIGLSIVTGFAKVEPLEIVVGCLFSFLTGLLSIHVLLLVAQKFKFSLFCIFMGLLALTSMLVFF